MVNNRVNTLKRAMADLSWRRLSGCRARQRRTAACSWQPTIKVIARRIGQNT